MPEWDRDERTVAAWEKIGEALTRIATLMEKAIDKQWPKKPEPKDATVTRIPSELDKLKASQGASDETTEEWIGLREQELIDKPK